MYVNAHLAITGAYLSIGVILVLSHMVEKRKHASEYASPTLADLGTKDAMIVRLVYALFIVVCGLGHIEGVVSFIWPNYPLFAIWHAFTAFISWAAVAITFKYRAHLTVGA